MGVEIINRKTTMRDKISALIEDRHKVNMTVYTKKFNDKF